MAEPTPDDATARSMALLGALLKDPTLGKEARDRARAMFPDATFTQDTDDLRGAIGETREELDTRLKAVEAAQAETAKAREDDKRSAEFVGDMNQAWSKYRLTEAGKEMALERMRTTGQFDPDAAAAWAAMQNPPAPSSPNYLGPVAANFDGSAQFDESMALLNRDPAGRFLDQHVTAILTDPDGYMAGEGPVL